MGIFEHEGGGMETYLTIAGLAEYLKISEQTVRRHVLNKTVPYHKIHKAVRFRVSEIEKWIDGGGLDGTVRAEPEDGRQGELFAGLDAAGAAGAGTGTGPAGAGIAGNEGDNTGGAA
jgi:excisionase family DNA binding protein